MLSVTDENVHVLLRQLRLLEQQSEVSQFFYDNAVEGKKIFSSPSARRQVGKARELWHSVVQTGDDIRRSLLRYYMQDNNLPDYVTNIIRDFRAADVDTSVRRDASRLPPPDVLVQQEMERLVSRPRRRESSAVHLLDRQRAELAIAGETYELERQDDDPPVDELLKTGNATSKASEHLLATAGTVVATISYLSRFLPNASVVPVTTPQPPASEKKIGRMLATAHETGNDKELAKYFSDPRNRPAYVSDLLLVGHMRTHDVESDDRSLVSARSAGGLGEELRIEDVAGVERDLVIGRFTAAVELFRYATDASADSLPDLIRSGYKLLEEGEDLHFLKPEERLFRVFTETLVELENLEQFLPPPVDRELGLVF